MSDDERLKLRPGDYVTVRMDDGIEREFTVKYGPWKLASGHMVIGLHGIVGGYLLNRVQSKLVTQQE